MKFWMSWFIASIVTILGGMCLLVWLLLAYHKPSAPNPMKETCPADGQTVLEASRYLVHKLQVDPSFKDLQLGALGLQGLPEVELAESDSYMVGQCQTETMFPYQDPKITQFRVFVTFQRIGPQWKPLVYQVKGYAPADAFHVDRVTQTVRP